MARPRMHEKTCIALALGVLLLALAGGNPFLPAPVPPVAQCEIEHFGAQKVLVVERFDRRLSATGDYWLRLPQEDFCQATATPPALKYEADGGPGPARPRPHPAGLGAP